MLSISERMAAATEHDSRSVELYKFIADVDFKECGDSFDFKAGGDGDNGEILMYLLDAYFESKDAELDLAAFDHSDNDSL